VQKSSQCFFLLLEKEENKQPLEGAQSTQAQVNHRNTNQVGVTPCDDCASAGAVKGHRKGFIS